MTEWGTSLRSDTVIGMLQGAVTSCPDRMFLDFSGNTYTYEQMWSRSSELARGLRKAGVAKGDTVVAMLDNNEDSVASWFGSNMIGAIWVGVNTALRGEFLRHVVADSGAKVVICEAELFDRFRLIEGGIDEVELVLIRGERPDPAAGRSKLTVDTVDAFRIESYDESWVESTSDDVSLLVYTGGTTGPSKGCTNSNGYVLNLCRRYIETTGRTSDELNWSPLPTYHFNIIAQTIMSSVLLRGSASIASKFSVSGFWPDMERTGARVVNLLGSMGALIAQMPDTDEMQRSFGKIRFVHGAPFPAGLQKVWHERFGVETVGGGVYGLTEAVPITTLAYGTVAPPGTSGKRNSEDFDVRIFDDDDREVPDGEVGEVVARPKRPNVMFQGYWRRPEATVSVMRNLWFHTGDLGRFDENGFFSFVDRKKDYLRRRGENISSMEIEATYLSHPDIGQVAVHPVPSELTEDDVKVTAVLVEGSTLTPVELFEWSKERVPYFALPRYIEFRGELPMSAVGRVHKYQLRDEGCTLGTWDREREDVSWERR